MKRVVQTEESNYMFQYFLKVVSTKYEMLSGTVVWVSAIRAIDRHLI